MNFSFKKVCEYPECTAYELLHGKRPTHVLRDAVVEETAEFDIELEENEYEIDMVEEFEIEEDVQVEDEEENVLITQHIVAKVSLKF